MECFASGRKSNYVFYWSGRLSLNKIIVNVIENVLIIPVKSCILLQKKCIYFFWCLIIITTQTHLETLSAFTFFFLIVNARN